MATGGAWPGRYSIHACGLTSFPIKVRSRDFTWDTAAQVCQSLKGLQVSSVCSFSAASKSPFISCRGWYT